MGSGHAMGGRNAERPGTAAGAFRFNRQVAPAYAWVAEARSSDTPGPMVELIETFFR